MNQLGNPTFTETKDMVVVSQSKTIAFALLIFSPGLPLLAFVASGKTPGAALADILGLQGLALGAALLLGLVLAAVFIYGLFWLLWHRRLVIDKTSGRFVFTTGIRPWISRYRGTIDDNFTLRCTRQTISGMNTAGDAGSMGGPGLVHWQLSMEIPGCKEPFFLGNFTEHAEAVTACQWWKRVMPNAALIDDGADS
jgi:hypothetical protein